MYFVLKNKIHDFDIAFLKDLCALLDRQLRPRLNNRRLSKLSKRQLP